MQTVCSIPLKIILSSKPVFHTWLSFSLFGFPQIFQDQHQIVYRDLVVDIEGDHIQRNSYLFFSVSFDHYTYPKVLKYIKIQHD